MRIAYPDYSEEAVTSEDISPKGFVRGSIHPGSFYRPKGSVRLRRATDKEQRQLRLESYRKLAAAGLPLGDRR